MKSGGQQLNMKVGQTSMNIPLLSPFAGFLGGIFHRKEAPKAVGRHLWLCLVLGALVASTSQAQAQTPAVTVDNDFNPSVNDAVYSIALQPDGKILVGGNFTTLGGQSRAYIGRLNPDGTIGIGLNPGPDGTVNSIAIQPDGKIIVGGAFTMLGGRSCSYIGRLNPDGTVDPSFNSGLGNVINSIAFQPDGKILVGGSFGTFNGQNNSSIGRLNPDGTVDFGFNPRADGNVNSIAMQPDGKILVGGAFTTLGGQSRAYIGRLNPDGTLDLSFNPNANSEISTIALQPDGKILVGGYFTTLGGQSRAYIGRLNTDGTVDLNFNPGADGIVNSIAVQLDGKILVGGGFTTLGGQSRAYIGRLNPDGTVDPSFNPGSSYVIYSIALQSDGKILVGGWFDTLGGQSRSYIGRLNNNSPATESLSFDGSTITWLRGGTGPEVWRTIFETFSGTIWQNLGSGTRIAGGWQLTGLSLPTNSTIRARGFVTEGYLNGSTWFVESIAGPPFITMHPTSQTVAIGQPASFGVVADGAKPLQFQWFVNGFPIPGATNPVFQIPSTTDSDNGNIYFVRVSNPAGSVDSQSATLTVIHPLDLPEALDAPSLIWTTSGSALWQAQTNVTHDGIDAAQSGAISDNMSSALNTTVTGPGTLRFWWKVSSESGYDKLAFYIGGVKEAEISGEVGWQFRAFPITNGLQSISWVYSKDISVSQGADAGWLDQVVFTEGTTPDPLISLHPESRTAFVGQTVELKCIVYGTEPVFQWYRDGSQIGGGQSTLSNSWTATLTLTDVQLTDSGNYWVVVSNTAGVVTSDVARVTVTGKPPEVYSEQQQFTLFVGEQLNLHPWVDGTPPLYFQWRKNGVDIPGANSPYLFLNNAKLSDAGDYVLVVSNAYGVATSSVSTVTILDRMAPPPGLVAWWRGEFDALDSIGNNHGTLQGLVMFDPGKVGYGFFFNGYENNFVSIPNAPALNPQATGFTVEFWMRGSPVASNFAIVDKSLGWVDSTGWGFNGDSSSGQVTFLMGIGGQGNSNFVAVTSTNGLLDSLFHHLAGVWDGNNLKLYVDGVLHGSAPLSTPANNGRPLNIGVSWGGGTPTAAFFGIVDELSIYQRALSDSEIQAIYQADEAGKWLAPVIILQPTGQAAVAGDYVYLNVQVTGSEPLNYQWLFQELPIQDATNAWLVLNNITTNQAGPYRVVVSNPAGVVTSDVALVTVSTELSLEAALDDSKLSWYSYGEVPWTPQRDQTYDQIDAAVSGSIGDGGETVLETAVYGPGKLSFWWRVSSETNADWLTFSTNGTMVERISGETTWQKVTVNIPPGHQILSWSYTKNASGSAGADAGWVDQVHFEPTISLVIERQPMDTVVNAGESVNFEVEASGDEPITYQWFKDGIQIPGATNNTYTINNVTTQDQGWYQVLVSNPLDSLFSVPVRLDVIANLFIEEQPENIEVVENQPAFFRVVASGAEPISYQWYWNGAIIPGADKPVFAPFTSPQFAGEYFVVVSNITGVVVSEPAYLIIEMDTEPPFLISANSLNGKWVDIRFNEFVDPATSLNPSNYFVYQPDGTAISVTQVVERSSTVLSGASRPGPTRLSLVLNRTISGKFWVLAQDMADISFLRNVGSSWQQGKTANLILRSIGTVPYSDVFMPEFDDFEILHQGRGLGATNDSLTFLSQTVQGDFDMQVELDRVIAEGLFHAGLMLRTGTSPSDSFWMIGLLRTNLSADGRLLVATRSRPGTYSAGNPWASGRPFEVLPVAQNPEDYHPDFLWLRLARSGGVISAYFSTDKTNWVLLSRDNIFLPANANVQVGLAIAGGFDETKRVQVEFSDFKIATAPRITRQPQDIFGDQSRFAIMDVEVEGDGNLTFQWFKNGMPLPGETNNAIYFHGIYPADEGVYHVRVTNQFGFAISSNASVTLGEAPFIVEFPESKVANSGEDVTFSVTAAGAQPLFYQWYSKATATATDGEQEPPSGSGAGFNQFAIQPVGSIEWGMRPIPGATNATLLLTNVNALQSGDFMVVVSNRFGLVSAWTHLDVRSAPIIISQPASQVVALGGEAFFSIALAGTEPFEFQWRFNGVDLPGAIEPFLELEHVTRENAGEYSVVIANVYGSVTSAPATLTVLSPPIIVQEPPPFIEATPGQPVSVSCVATGSYPIYYQWFRNGKPLRNATNQTLVISAFKPEESGTYWCSAGNYIGAAISRQTLIQPQLDTLPLADNFADLVITNSLQGLGRGNNIGATREPGEPVHAGKRGTNSVWFGWQPMAGGIGHVSIEGSSFPALLAVYTGDTISNLTLRANNESPAGITINEVRFNVEPGDIFKIAIDGFGYATGIVVLHWWLDVTDQRIPDIISIPTDTNAAIGDTASFHLELENAPDVEIQWLFFDSVIASNQNTLQLTNLSDQQVGLWKVVAYRGTNLVVERTIDLQINQIDGVPDSRIAARDSFLDSFNTNNFRHLQQTGNIGPGSRNLRRATGPASGFTGTQIFNTSASTTEPGEPVHCGIAGGASEWFSYQAPTNGTLIINTSNSTFDTVLAVYDVAGNLPPSGFEDLRSVACDDDSLGGGLSQVSFTTAADIVYYIAIDGKAGARGTARINYQLVPPPAITAHPTSKTVPPSTNVAFTVSAVGTNLVYMWRKEASLIPGATNSSLVLSNVSVTNAGSYSVVVSNIGGVVTSAVATLGISGPPAISSQPTNRVALAGSSHTFNVIATGDAPLQYQWRFNSNNIPNATNASYALSNLSTSDSGAYSVVISNNYGAVTSSAANLTVATLSSFGITAIEDTATNITLGTAGLSYTIVTNPVYGALSGSGNTRTYTPITNFNGTDSFSFRASDGLITSAVYTVSLTVTPVNEVTPYLLDGGKSLTAGTQPYALAAGDINGDAKPDLAVANYASSTVSLLLTDSTGTNFSAAISLAVSNQPSSVALSDFNQDGKLDLAVAHFSLGIVSVWLGDGTGNFTWLTNKTVGSNPVGLITGDFNLDNRVDLAVANNATTNLSILWGTGNGSFSNAVTLNVQSNPIAIAVADLNGDSKPDLLAVNQGSRSLSVLMGNGTGGFTNAVNYSVGTNPVSVAAGDFNGDGRADVAVVNRGSASLSIFLADTGGSLGLLTNYAFGVQPAAILTADFDKDGKLDLAVADQSANALTILPGNGQGRFTNYYRDPGVYFTLDQNPVALVAADFNRDNQIDIAAANYGTNSVKVWFNNHFGLTFPPRIAAEPPDWVVHKGINLNLTATVAGSNLVYQWYFNSNIISGATNSTLSLTNLQNAHAGYYSLVITNAACAVTSRVASLTVLGEILAVSGRTNGLPLLTFTNLSPQTSLTLYSSGNFTNWTSILTTNPGDWKWRYVPSTESNRLFFRVTQDQ